MDVSLLQKLSKGHSCGFHSISQWAKKSGSNSKGICALQKTPSENTAESVSLILYQQVKSQIVTFGGDSASVVLVVTDGTLLDVEETVVVVSY